MAGLDVQFGGGLGLGGPTFEEETTVLDIFLEIVTVKINLIKKSFSRRKKRYIKFHFFSKTEKGKEIQEEEGQEGEGRS